MWVTDYYAEATMMMKKEEAARLRLVSEARRPRGVDGSAPAWSWRIEPGMEGAFEDLQRWFLPSQRGAAVETPALTVGAGEPGEETRSREPRQSPVRPGWPVPMCCGVTCCAA